MENRQIIAMLNYPDSGLVDYAVKRANLTVPEWNAIQDYVFRGETAERTAERLEVSVGTISNRRKNAFNKLDQCWSGLQWVGALSPTTRFKQ